MATALDKIGDLLVQKGLLSREQLDACLREVQQSQASGKPLLLSDVIVSKGFADRVRLTQTVQVLAEIKFHCSKCRTPYNIRSPKIDAAYVCKRCGAPLEVDDVQPSQNPAPTASKPAGPPPEVVEAAKDPKRVMGKYTLVKELGRGGMAVVYKAWDETLDQYIALKLIRTQDLGLSEKPEDETVQEFLREARTAVKLQHENIVRVYELGRHGDRHFLSMEYVEGKSLAELLRTSRESRNLPFYSDVKRYLGYLRDVARALDYTHRRNPPIVHRDIKPQNILVEDGGRVCVVDFGLAKELKGAGHLTRTGIAKGTPCYMAPEQATGKAIDGRTDVYALGVILYEFMTGHPPFTGPTEREILNKIVGDDPVPPSAALKAKGIVAPIIPDLEQICLKALGKLKEQRYRTAGEFADEITRFFEGRSVQARPVSAAERSWRWLLKRKAVAIATSAAVLMGVVALVAIFRGKEERIVERVTVVNDVSPERKAALEAIDRLEAEFRFDSAARACDDLLRKTQEESQRSALKQKRDDFRLQAVLFSGLSLRITPTLPVQPKFQLLGEPASEVRFLSAEPESLRVVRHGRPVSVSWARIDPRQLLELVKVAWPDMDARSTLALGVWCLRQGMSEEATALFSRPGAGLESAESRRYQDELKAKESKPDLTESQQVTRLVKEAEAALAKEDLIIARARFERALVLTKDDPRILRGLEKVAELEKKKEGGAAAVEPKAPPTEPAPAAKSEAASGAKVGELKLPGSQIVGTFSAIHGRFAQALHQGDLAAAAQEWKTAQSALGDRAVPFTRDVSVTDLDAAKALLHEAIVVIEGDKVRDELALRQVFALRDLVTLVQTYADLDAAVERLIKTKTEVTLYAQEPGKIKKGTLDRSKGILYFNEVVQVEGAKGTVGMPISLRGGEGKALPSWDVSNLFFYDRGPKAVDTGIRFGELLLISYGGKPGDLKPLEEFQKEVAGKPAEPKLRLKEYLELRRTPIVFSMDLLAAENRAKWSRKGTMVQVDDLGLLLKQGEDVVSAFEGLWLEPGMKVQMKFRVEKSEQPDRGELNIGLMVLNAGTGWVWSEMANFFPNSKPADMSFLDLASSSSQPNFVKFPYQAGDLVDLVLDYSPTGTTVTASGTKIGTLPYKAPARRLLILCIRNIQVRFTRMVVSGNSQAPAAPVKSASEPGKADDLVAAGVFKYNNRDYKGAIDDFSMALERGPLDPALVYILRGTAHLELNEQREGQIDFKEAIKAGGKSNTGGAYVGLARIRIANRDYLQAISYLNDALAQSPQFTQALRLRAICNLAKGQLAESLADLTEAMKLEPNFGSDYGQRAIIAYQYGQWMQAVSDSRQALQYGTWNDEAMAWFLYMGRCRLGEKEAAAKELREWIATRTPSSLHAAWCFKIIGHLLGTVTESDLYDGASQVGAGTVKGHQAEAFYYIGTRRLIDGSVAGARDSFQKCIDSLGDSDIEINLAKAELARLDGKPDAPMPVIAAPKPAPAAAPEPPKPAAAAAGVKLSSSDEAVAKAVAALRANLAVAQNSFSFQGRRMVHTELVLWTFLNAGVPMEDFAAQALLKEMLAEKLESTFGVSLQAMVLDRIDRVKYQRRIAMCAQFLVDNQSAQGTWGYGSPSIYVEDVAYANSKGQLAPGTGKRMTVEKNRDGEGGDVINSFFAALGLRACRNANVAVQKSVIEASLKWIRATQKRSIAPPPVKPKDWYAGEARGWCYHDHADHEAYGSATAAAVASEAIWMSIWDDFDPKKASWKRDKTVQDGIGWMIQNYSLTYNPGPYEHAQMTKDSKHQYLFWMFALQQALTLTGVDDLSGRAWHTDGSKVLVETQGAGGVWSGNTTFLNANVPADLRGTYASGTLADTCFAVLFLKKSGQPLPDTTKPKK